MSTIRRDVLKRKLARGELEARCRQHLTDDYAFDAADNFGRTDWMPAAYSDDLNIAKVINGVLTFSDSEFEGRSGRALKRDDGTVTLWVHSNLAYELRASAA